MTSGQSWAAVVKLHQKNSRNTLWWPMRYTSLSSVPSIFLLMLHCLVCQCAKKVSQLWPFQGFLYVFGGMLDSAYTLLTCPLWLFDIGELFCGGACKVQVMLAADVMILSAYAQAWQTRPVVARLSWEKHSVPQLSCVWTLFSFHRLEKGFLELTWIGKSHFKCLDNNSESSKGTT